MLSVGSHPRTRSVLALTLAMGGLSAPLMASMPNAQAADGITIDNGAKFSTSIAYDGTGQGTSAQCFIRQENGFTGPTDENNKDGVVCTGDKVGYNIAYAFPTTEQETKYRLQVKLDDVTSLSPLQAPALENFCKPDATGIYQAAIVKSDSTGVECEYTVPAGRSISGLWDTEFYIDKQVSQWKPTITARVVGGAESTVPTDNVQVVHVPMVDAAININDGGNTTYNGQPYHVFHYTLGVHNMSASFTNAAIGKGRNYINPVIIDNLTATLGTLPAGAIIANPQRLTLNADNTITYAPGKVNVSGYSLSESNAYGTINVYVPRKKDSTSYQVEGRITRADISRDAATSIYEPNFGKIENGLNQPSNYNTTSNVYPGPYGSLTSIAQGGFLNNDWSGASWTDAPDQEPRYGPYKSIHPLSNLYGGLSNVGYNQKYWASVQTSNYNNEGATPTLEKVALCDSFYNQPNKTYDKAVQYYDDSRSPLVQYNNSDMDPSKYVLYYNTDATKQNIACNSPYSAFAAESEGWSSTKPADPKSIVGVAVVFKDNYQLQTSMSSNTLSMYLPFTTGAQEDYAPRSRWVEIPDSGSLYYTISGGGYPDRRRDTTAKVSIPSQTLYSYAYSNFSTTGARAGAPNLDNVKAGSRNFFANYDTIVLNGILPTEKTPTTVKTHTEISSCALDIAPYSPWSLSSTIKKVSNTITPPNVGPDGIACTSDDVSGWIIDDTYLWTPDGTNSSSQAFETYSDHEGYYFTVAPWATPGTVITGSNTVSATTGALTTNTQTSAKTAVSTNPTVGQYKTTYQQREKVGTRINWLSTFFNTKGVDATNIEFMDILPYNGDGRGTKLSKPLEGVTLAMQNVPEGSKLYVTKAAPNTLVPDTQNAANDPANTSLWCEYGSDACPTKGDYTAWLLTVPSLENQRVFTVAIGADTVGQKNGDLATNSLGAGYAQSLNLSILQGNNSTIALYENALAGYVYSDNDASKVRDAGEPGVKGWKVELLREDGTVAATTTTDAQGYYIFDHLDAATYKVRVDKAAGDYSMNTQAYNTSGTNVSNNIVLNNDSRITNANFGLAPAPAYTITKTVDRTEAALGDTLRYTIRVANTGTITLRPTFEDRGCTGLSGPTGDTGTSGTLSAAETWTYTCTYKLTEADQTAGKYINTAKVTMDEGNPDLPDTSKEASATTTVSAPPAVIIDKTADITEGKLVAVGTPVTWSYKVTNTGGSTLSNYTVSDDKLGTVCTLSNLAPGQSQTCTKTGTIQ